MAVILVTGGAGYVGSHVCKALAKAGHQPVVYDNLSRGWRAFVKWGPFVEGDVRDHDRLVETMKRHRPAAVMHFAAFAYVGESVSRPDLYYDNNVGGTRTLLDAMRTAGLDAIVFSSTCATYGEPEISPISEDTPQVPINPYGFSKLVCERMMTDYQAAWGLRSVRLRYFNAAGGDPEGEIGEVHVPETHLIPLALEAALGKRTLSVFGDDYPTPDGTAVRDYIHVVDLADAHVRALQRLLDGGASLAVNLGVGRGLSVREIIDSVRRVTGREPVHQIAPRRPGDPAVLVAAPALALAELGWRAERSGADVIIADAWRWSLAQAEAAPAIASAL